MSLLNGGLRRNPDTINEFTEQIVCGGITREEWARIAELPPLRDVIELFAVLTHLRTRPRLELHPAHPLSTGAPA